MAKRPFVSANPVSFTDDKGNHHVVPLSTLYLNEEGELVATDYDTYKDLLPYLGRLLKSGAIWQAPEPAPEPALKVTAITQGATGVLIEIEFTKVEVNEKTPGDSTVKVTVTETNTYSDLPLDKLIETLGDGTTKGTHPGLVFVGSTDTLSLPKEGEYEFLSNDPNQPREANLDKHGGSPGEKAFLLKARGPNDKGEKFLVTLKDLDKDKQTFTLVVSWTKTVTDKAVSSIADELAFVVEIEPPDKGYRVPAKGRVLLKGGVDAISAPARAASATVLTS